MEFEFDEDAVEAHLAFHIVFSTAGQREVLPDEGMDGLYAFIREVLADLGAAAEGIGGTANHVHIVSGFPPDRSMDEIVRTVKSESAKWVRASFSHLQDFSWQESYGGFSLCPSNLATGAAFVREQAEYHEIVSYQDEFRTLLREHDIPFEEDDLWD